MKDIDERNKTLIKLKLETTTTQQTLNKLKKQLTDELNDAVGYDREMRAKMDSLAKKEKDIDKSHEKLDRILHENKKLLTFKQSIGKEMDNAKEFVEKKNEHIQLVKKKKDIQRQIEIAELEAKKARRILKHIGDTSMLNAPQHVL